MILIFDFDGTIADSFDTFLEIMRTLSKKHNLNIPSDDEIEELRSKDPRSIIKELKVPLYKIPFLAREMKQAQKNVIHTVRPISNLPKILKKLKNDGHIMGIVTSNSEENVQLFLKKHQLDMFDFVRSSSGMFGKDRTLKKILKEYSNNCNHAFYIGDEIRDIQACQKIGLPIISVTWGFNTKDGLQNWNPSFLVETPQELYEVVKLSMV